MGTAHYKYPVRLSEEQHRWLATMVHTSRTPAKHYLVARVLLMSDQRQGEPSHTDGQIAEVLSISRRTVIRDPRSGLSKKIWRWLSSEASPENTQNAAAWMAREKPNSFIWLVARLQMGDNAGRWNSSLTRW